VLVSHQVSTARQQLVVVAAALAHGSQQEQEQAVRVVAVMSAQTVQPTQVEAVVGASQRQTQLSATAAQASSLCAVRHLPHQQQVARPQAQQVRTPITHSQATEASLGRYLMAHFARIGNGVVLEVNVINNAVLGDTDFPESEPIGQAFIASLGIAGEWKQTSYNSNFRGKYAGIGDIYDAEADEFVTPNVETPA
jgi:hypothetical protein